jgi:hypothetical protein
MAWSGTEEWDKDGKTFAKVMDVPSFSNYYSHCLAVLFLNFKLQRRLAPRFGS